MNIVVVGIGYVGIVTAVCLAEKGHNVTCVDVDSKKIEMLKNGKAPMYEPHSDKQKKVKKVRLSFKLFK